jgi:hypothetical protein
MDAETRRTLAATIPSTFVRVSSVFVALLVQNRENGASACKKTKWKEKKRKKKKN